jgi:two-component system phosphate regulon sensor histidine kinase PhoR
MPLLSFRTKLLASYLGLVATVELITILVLNQSLAADLVAHLDERLEQQAYGCASWVSLRHEQHGENAADPSTDRQAIRLAGVVHAWVTIIDEHGNLVGDSERAKRPHPASGLHIESDPEVLGARHGEVGRATRVAEGHEGLMHFVAVRAESGEVVRLGIPIAGVQATIRAMRNRLVVASMLAFVVALGLGLLAARIVVEPLRAMTSTASRMAQGDYDIAVPPSAADEFGVLARALASLASQLKAHIGDLVYERDRLSAILTGMVEGVLVIASDGRIAIANPSAATILRAQGALERMPIAEAIKDERLRRVLEHADVAPRTLELEGEGSERSLLINVRPLASSAGGGVVAVLHDVTQLRRLENVRKEFVANMSHELRTPVAAIQGYAETLLRSATPLDEKTRGEFLDVIHRHARRIGRLVEDLLSLSAIEATPPEKVVREPVSIRDLAVNVAETARDRLAARKVDLAIELDAPLVAIGDPDGIERVLDNLVDNAIKYGREAGRIRIRGVRNGDRVLLTVEDDGPGIAEEHLPHLFERFYRVDRSRSRAFGGAGLGLAIVKRLLESMGGTIRVESALGQGTRFTIDLVAGA